MNPYAMARRTLSGAVGMEALRPREGGPVPGCDYETYFETGLYLSGCETSLARPITSIAFGRAHGSNGGR